MISCHTDRQLEWHSVGFPANYVAHFVRLLVDITYILKGMSPRLAWRGIGQYLSMISHDLFTFLIPNKFYFAKQRSTIILKMTGNIVGNHGMVIGGLVKYDIFKSNDGKANSWWVRLYINILCCFLSHKQSTAAYAYIIKILQRHYKGTKNIESILFMFIRWHWP